MNERPLEYCCDCGTATGKAGPGDDSLYTDDGGPYCQACYDHHRVEILETRLAALRLAGDEMAEQVDETCKADGTVDWANVIRLRQTAAAWRKASKP